VKRRDLVRHLEKHEAKLLREGRSHSYWGIDAERSSRATPQKGLRGVAQDLS
jgi:hypothetical protein